MTCFDLPLECSLVNYADDNHMCNENENLEMLKDHIESDAMTANADKFQSILLSRGSTRYFMVNVDGHSIPPNNTLKMLGVTLNDKQKTYIRNICLKVSRQINALKCISKFSNEQCRMHV